MKSHCLVISVYHYFPYMLYMHQLMGTNTHGWIIHREWGVLGRLVLNVMSPPNPAPQGSGNHAEEETRVQEPERMEATKKTRPSKYSRANTHELTETFVEGPLRSGSSGVSELIGEGDIRMAPSIPSSEAKSNLELLSQTNFLRESHRVYIALQKAYPQQQIPPQNELIGKTWMFMPHNALSSFLCFFSLQVLQIHTMICNFVFMESPYVCKNVCLWWRDFLSRRSLFEMNSSLCQTGRTLASKGQYSLW